MKKLYRHLFIVGLLSGVLFGSCTEDNNNGPTSPSGIEIIVDNQNPNAVRPPCGTEDAVCGTITDGLLSAARFQTGIPTILIKSGTYNAEPTFPIQIHIPVILQAEQAGEVVVVGPSHSSTSPFETIVITASDVIIDRLKIVSGTDNIISVGGKDVTLKNISVEGNSPYSQVGIYVEGNVSVWNSRMTDRIGVHEKGTAHIEETEIYGGSISSDGYLTLKNSVVYEGGLSLDTKKTIMKNSTLYGGVYQHEAQTEFSGSTVYGDIEIWDGEATLTDNMIEGKVYAVRSKLTLTGNTIQWFPEDKTDLFYEGAIQAEGKEASLKLVNNTILSERIALWLVYHASAFISRNRFDSARDDFIFNCEAGTTPVSTDGTNRLLNPNCRVGCGVLPEKPGSEPF